MMMYVMIIRLVIQSSQAEVFSSVDDMKSVFQLERNIVMELLNLAEKFRAKLNKIQRYIRDFEKSLIDRDSDAAENSAKPFFMYLAIQSIHLDQSKLEVPIEYEELYLDSYIDSQLRKVQDVLCYQFVT